MDWLRSATHALPVTAFLLGLLYYWFAVADRYAVFLYEHLGATPFDAVTSSRYWMAGLVANGFVLALYPTILWLLGRIAATRQVAYTPPDWRRVWLLSAAPLAVGITWITMTQNAPTLPVGLALMVVASTPAGLALALWPGRWAAEQPVELIWLAGDGLGIALLLFTVRLVEWPSQALLAPSVAYAVVIAGIILAIIWLAVMTILRRRRVKPMPGAGVMLATGFGLMYLLLPLMHYLLATPSGYRYISTSSNFFAFSPGVQVLTWGIAVLAAQSVARARAAIG